MRRTIRESPHSPNALRIRTAIVARTISTKISTSVLGRMLQLRCKSAADGRRCNAFARADAWNGVSAGACDAATHGANPN